MLINLSGLCRDYILYASIFFFIICVFSIDEQSTSFFAYAFDNGFNSSSFNPIFEKVKDSVVQVTTAYSAADPFNSNYTSDELFKFGSGFVINETGLVITTYVTVSSANSIIVTFDDGSSYMATVIGVDPYENIALLKLESPLDENLQPVTFSNSSTIKTGDPVLTVGEYDNFGKSLIDGIVSRNDTLVLNSDFNNTLVPNMILTNLDISTGNTGGPLLNSEGKVVGMINAVKNMDNRIIGFAIPLKTLNHIIPSLLNTGTYEHPWLGISGSKLSPVLAESFGLPHNYKGFLVDNVVPNGPADKAGLQGMLIQGNRFGEQQILDKDIIIAIDNKSVSKLDNILSYVESFKKVGDNVTFTVNRNGQIIYLIATLEPRPDIPLQETQSLSEQGNNDSLSITPFPNFKLPELPDFKLPDFTLPGLNDTTPDPGVKTPQR